MKTLIETNITMGILKYFQFANENILKTNICVEKPVGSWRIDGKSSGFIENITMAHHGGCWFKPIV